MPGAYLFNDSYVVWDQVGTIANMLDVSFWLMVESIPEGDIGEDHRDETHLIPRVLEVALGERDVVPVYGIAALVWMLRHLHRAWNG